MKQAIFILTILLMLVPYGRAQELKLHPKEERFLDSLSRAMIQKFGDKGYYELCKNEKPVIAQYTYDAGYDKRFKRNNGRKYYQVLYPNPDSLKSVRLECEYAVFVLIWQDCKKAYNITFGNGAGFMIAGTAENEKTSEIKRVMPFDTINFGALEAKWRNKIKGMEECVKKQRKEVYEKEKERLEQEKMKKEQSL